MNGHVLAMTLPPTARTQTINAAAPRPRAVSGMPNPIRESTVTRVPTLLRPLAPALPDEALIHRQASLAAVRLRCASAHLEAQARDALLAGLEERGLRVAVLSAVDTVETAPASDAAQWQQFSLAELEQIAGPVCDVFIVGGYDDLPLPSVNVRPTEDGERCALYEVHAGDAPERISVRCDGDLSRHADVLVDWILAIA